MLWSRRVYGARLFSVFQVLLLDAIFVLFGTILILHS
jgi:hypothetical protein